MRVVFFCSYIGLDERSRSRVKPWTLEMLLTFHKMRSEEIVHSSVNTFFRSGDLRNSFGHILCLRRLHLKLCRSVRGVAEGALEGVNTWSITLIEWVGLLILKGW